MGVSGPFLLIESTDSMMYQCGERPQQSRGVWGHAPRKFVDFGPSESEFDALSSTFIFK